MEFQLHQEAFYRQQQIAFSRHMPVSDSGKRAILLPYEVKLELLNKNLWQKFHAETNEMIITKAGRRMFPSIQLSVSGLERLAQYHVLVEVAPTSQRRYKYVGTESSENGFRNTENGEWISVGPAEPQAHIRGRIYQHPDGPASGQHWLKHPFNFNNLKLSNNTVDPKNKVLVMSMHKYIPRIWIVRCDRDIRLTNDHLYSYPSATFSFKETEFIAVTAYQNEVITKLKIDNNPYARGFRETGKSQWKRKFMPQFTEGGPTDNEAGNESIGLESSGTDHLEVSAQKRKRSNSETGSFDNSASSSGGIRLPLPSNHPEILPPSVNDHHEEVPPKFHRPWLDSPSQIPPSKLTSRTPNLACAIQNPRFLAHHVLRSPFAIHLHFHKPRY